MIYADYFRFNEGEYPVKQKPCITAKGAPTEQTEGAVGLFYMDEDTGAVYKCIAADDENGVYTWDDMGGKDSREETDQKYFDIDYDGVVSLKPEYRGRPGHELEDESFGVYPYAISDNGPGVDGSKLGELPEEIVIPEVINGTAVAGFQPGMFYANFRVTKITLPSTVLSLPALFCYDARYLQEICNTEHIRELGMAAFRNTRLSKALFPNLRTWGDGVFYACVLLSIIGIGDHVDGVPSRTFRGCRKLSRVLGGGNVKSVGEGGFYRTTSLRNLSFLPQVTSVGDMGFASSRINFDWSSISGCEFGNMATPVLDNDCDYWRGALFTPCEQPLNTLMNQKNPLWKDIQISQTGKTYRSGCATFSLLHIHSAISGKTYETPMQFVADLESKGWSPYDFIGSTKLSSEGIVVSNAVLAARMLGYAVTANVGAEPITRERYQELCDKLSFGAYGYAAEGAKQNPNGGHAVILYGINDIGEVLVADSDNWFCFVNLCHDGFTTCMPLQNFTGPQSDLIIVEKLAGLTVRVGEKSGVRYLDGTDDVLTAEVKDSVLYVDGDFSVRVEDGVLYVD